MNISELNAVYQDRSEQWLRPITLISFNKVKALNINSKSVNTDFPNVKREPQYIFTQNRNIFHEMTSTFFQRETLRPWVHQIYLDRMNLRLQRD